MSEQKQLIKLKNKCNLKTLWPRRITNLIFRSHFKDINIPKVHVEEFLAKGAFGIVVKVIQQKQEVDEVDAINHKHHEQALKILKKSKIIEENCLQQIKNEADIQKLCGHHPFIVQQIDLWQNRYNLFILSEYVPNGELFAKIKYFPLDLVRIYLAEIALALDFLHNAGVIYRDIKPENILLTEQYHIKLTDFGLSKWLKFGSTTNTFCGTLKYMGTII